MNKPSQLASLPRTHLDIATVIRLESALRASLGEIRSGKPERRDRAAKGRSKDHSKELTTLARKARVRPSSPGSGVYSFGTNSVTPISVNSASRVLT